MVENKTMRMTIWILGSLTLVGTFAAVSAVTANQTTSYMWAGLAGGTFIIGYVTLLIGIVNGFFDGDFC
jgi:hypothetical protein